MDFNNTNKSYAAIIFCKFATSSVSEFFLQSLRTCRRTLFRFSTTERRIYGAARQLPLYPEKLGDLFITPALLPSYSRHIRLREIRTRLASFKHFRPWKHFSTTLKGRNAHEGVPTCFPFRYIFKSIEKRSKLCSLFLLRNLLIYFSV